MKQSSLKAYVTPTSMAEAIRVLNEYSGNMRIVAGATDMFVIDHDDLDALLDIGKLGLDYITEEAGYITIGAGATFDQILRSPLVKSSYAALWESAAKLADASTRNMATIGGNICSAVPSGDSIPAVLVLDATLSIAGPQGERQVKAGDFFTGPRQTVLQRAEILKDIQIPKQAKCGSAFEKIARTSLDLAIVNAAAWVSVNQQGEIAEAKVALGAVAPTVVRVPALEQALKGKKGIPADATFNEMISKVIAPIDNVRSTAEYRGDMCPVLARRTLDAAYQRAVENK